MLKQTDSLPKIASSWKTHPFLCGGIAASLLLNSALVVTVLRYKEEQSLQFSQVMGGLNEIQQDMSNTISESVWEIEDILIKQTSLISDFSYHIQPRQGGKIVLMLSAKLKMVEDGQLQQFTANVDGGAQQRLRSTVQDNIITSQIVLPACDTISIGLLVSDEFTSKTETITELSGIAQGLTSHLTIRPSLSIENFSNGNSARLSGEVYLINTTGSSQNRTLNTYSLDLVYNDTVLKTFSFETMPAAGGGSEQVLNAQLSPYPIPVDSPATLLVVANATDVEGFSYRCVVEQFDISAQGKVTLTPNMGSTYFSIIN